MDKLLPTSKLRHVHQPQSSPCLSLAALVLCTRACLGAAAPAEQFQTEIRPILEKHCFECHGAEKQKADLNLALFTDFEQVRTQPATWQLVLERVQAFEMPPKGNPELEFSKHQ